MKSAIREKNTHIDTHTHTTTTKNTTLLYKESRLTIQMDKTTQSAWRQGRERAAERTSVAKQTESRERLSASQQCTAITTERKTQNGDTAQPSVFAINYTDSIYYNPSKYSHSAAKLTKYKQATMTSL